MYLCQPGQKVPQSGLRVQLLGSGSILRESLAAQSILEKDWGISRRCLELPSFNELARDGQDVRALEPAAPAGNRQTAFVAQQLAAHARPGRWPRPIT